MDDSTVKFVSLIPLAEAHREPPAPPWPPKVPAETRTSEEEAAERIVKTSKYKA